MSWLNELISPRLKCARVGHGAQMQFRHGMRKTAWEERHRGVCVSFTSQRTICARCNAELEVPKEINASGVDSWSAPSSIWDEFRASGVWFRDSWSSL